MDVKKLYINGQWKTPLSRAYIEVENPASGEIIGKIPRANEEDVNLAVRSAKEALKGWELTELSQRIELVESLVKELNKKKDEFADIIVKELGRGRDSAMKMHTLPYLKDAENYIKIAEEYDFQEKQGDTLIRKEAVGVVAAFTPWNYPLGQIIKKVIPALLTGNTFILKPSQNTPLTAYILTEAIDKVGFPEGVFNLVTGTGSEVGDILTKHPHVNMVTFTGSTETGKNVAQRALQSIKRITLELGGKSPSIILKDADLEKAVATTLDIVYGNTGQTCSAYTRLLVPKEYKEEVEELVISQTKEYPFGDPQESDANIGPLVSRKQFDKVKGYIEKGIEEGAKLIYGQVPKLPDRGYYIKPVVFTDVKNNMTIAREEIFGPVLSIISYQDKEEAIKLANDSPYGLSSAVFGPYDEALEVAKRIKAGNVQINGGKRFMGDPFGGFKQSGLGREGGVYGLEEFLEIKAIY